MNKAIIIAISCIGLLGCVSHQNHNPISVTKVVPFYIYTHDNITQAKEVDLFFVWAIYKTE